MNSLIIDCSSGMSVYVLKNEEQFLKIDNNQKKHTDELLLVVDDLLKDADLKIQEIDNLCVCVGPGSFTGIRVAISVVKGLAVASGSKVFILNNFDIYDVNYNDNVVCVLEGFSKFIYSRTVKNGIINDECIEFQDLANKIKNDNFKIYVQNEKLQNLFKNYEINSNIVKNSTILRFLNKLKNNESIELNMIEPIYLRASQAEIERNKKLAGDK